MGYPVQIDFFQTKKKMNEQTEEFLDAVKRNDINEVKKLLKDPSVDPTVKDNCAIRVASRDGYLEIVQILLKDPRVDPNSINGCPIGWASMNGHINIVRELLKDPRVDPSIDNNYVIRWASLEDRIDIVRLLLNHHKISKEQSGYSHNINIQNIIKERQQKQIAIIFFASKVRGTWRYLGPEIAKHITF